MAQSVSFLVTQLFPHGSVQQNFLMIDKITSSTLYFSARAETESPSLMTRHPLSGSYSKTSELFSAVFYMEKALMS